MLKFNNSNIITGYIKQLLSSFNLPTIDVITDNVKILVKEQLYIYNNKVIKITNSTLQENLKEGENYKGICDYKYGDYAIPVPPVSVLNDNINKQLTYIPFTKKFQNKSQIYDSETHRYLGDYLRFLKNYQNLNLMSLYNCFSNEIVNNMAVSWNQIIFNSNDEQYKIYMVPVKFFEKYTIAIQSSLPIEICCGFRNVTTITNNDIIPDTYVKYKTLNFESPVIYNKLLTCFSDSYLDTDMVELVKEANLVMFIKLPVKNKSSIVVLEGNYVANNDFIIDNETKYIKYNQSVVNIDGMFKTSLDKYNGNIPNLLSPLQLLKFNSGVSYPFADRLIEYLTHNVVDSLDETADNVKRIQKYINRIGGRDNPIIIKYPGIWEDAYQYILYGLTSKRPNKTYFDVLGYCDKDIEQLMGDVNIYTDLTNSNKGV